MLNTHYCHPPLQYHTIFLYSIILLPRLAAERSMYYTHILILYILDACRQINCFKFVVPANGLLMTLFHTFPRLEM